MEQPSHDDDPEQIVRGDTRLPRWLKDALQGLARAHKRSYNGEVVWALSRYVEEQERDTGRRNART
jgi:hypothetical protein